MGENLLNTQTSYSLPLLTLELSVANIRGGRTLTKTQIDTSKPLLEVYPNTMFSFLELSKVTQTKIRTYISCFTSNYLLRSKTDDILTVLFFDYSKTRGRMVWLKLRF